MTMWPLVAMENTLFGDPALDWPARCARIAEAGFSGVYVVPQKEENLARLRDLGRVAAQHGLKVAGCYANIDLGLEPAADVNARTRRIFDEVNDTPRVEVSFKCSVGEVRGDLERAVADRLLPLLKTAERRGFDVALYPHSFYPLETIAQAEKIITQFAHPRLSLVFATSHVYAITSTADALAQLRVCAPRLASFNVCGCRRNGDFPPAKCQHFPIGEGDLDLHPFFSVLAAAGYRGDVIVQGHGWSGDLPKMLRRCATAAAELFTRVNE